jgi:hypothetical protein
MALTAKAFNRSTAGEPFQGASIATLQKCSVSAPSIAIKINGNDSVSPPAATFFRSETAFALPSLDEPVNLTCQR